jgi:general secretion pathway protein G
MNVSPFFRRALINHRTDRRGFTLMEMLIVLTIIALLMGMVIFQVADFGSGAKVEKARADLLAFKEMLAAYELDNGSLPTTEQGLKALSTKPTTEPVPPRWRALLEQETLDPWGHPYVYRNPGKHTPDKYDVSSMGEDGLPDTEDDIGNWPDAKSASTH